MMMSKCFIGFLISDLGEPNIYQNLVCLQELGIPLGVVSDCEELSGGYLQEEVRLVLVDIDINL